MSSPRVVLAVSEALCAEFFDADSRRIIDAAAVALGDAAGATRVDRLGEVDDLSETRVLITQWGADRLDEALLQSMPELRLVAHTGASLKFFVTDAVFDREIAVTQAGQAMSAPVAEVSLTFTLALLHRVHRFDHALRTDAPWDAASAQGAQHELAGSVVAVIGASRTGRAYLAMIRALGAVPLVVDPTLTEAEATALGARLVGLDEALSDARIVALHAPSLPETHHLIGVRELALMPDGAGLVNTARSWLVDETALLAELRTGRIDAAIDVFDAEPLPADHPLRTLPNTLLTPHRAAGTHEGRLRAGRIVADEITAFVAGDPLTQRITREQLATMA